MLSSYSSCLRYHKQFIQASLQRSFSRQLSTVRALQYPKTYAVSSKRFILFRQASVDVKAFPRKTRALGPGAYFLLIIPVASFGLGTWQVQRKKWKENLIEDLVSKTRMAPVPLPFEDAEINELEYRPVIVTGEFDHKNEMYLGPRSCLIDGDSTKNLGKLISSPSKRISGYLVVTPFILSHTKERILVNRGWIPFEKKKPMLRQEGQIKGEVEIKGIVRLTEPRPLFGPSNKLDVGIWFYRDVEGMANILNTRPVFIDATAESTVPGGPIGGQTKAFLRNEHLSYILTWYGLSAATGAMWYVKFFR